MATTTVGNAERFPFWLFGVLCLFLIGLAAFASLGIGLVVGDAVASSYAASSVFFGSSPRLANVSFVWPPLPSLAQLPLVLIPPLRQAALSGGIVSAVLGAATAAEIWLFATRMGWALWARILLTIVFLANPMVLFYSTNGTSEIWLTYFAVAGVRMYSTWRVERRFPSLAGVSLVAAGALLTRFDALILVGLLAVFVALAERLGKYGSYTRAEGVTLAFLIPSLSVISLLVVLNWAITGDVLDFYRGARSIGEGLSIVARQNALVGSLAGSAGGAFSAVAVVSIMLIPALALTSIAVLVVSVVRRDSTGFLILSLSLAYPVYVAVLTATGQSAIWLGSLFIVLPMSFLHAVWLGGQVRHFAIKALLCLALGASALASGSTMICNPFDGQRGEDVFMRSLLAGRLVADDAAGWTAEKSVGAYLRDHGSRGRILADDSQADAIILFSGRPEYFVTPGDESFDDLLANPAGRVEYVVSRSVGDQSQIDRVSAAFGDACDSPVVELRQELEAGGWRVCQVVDSAAEEELRRTLSIR